MCDDFQRITSEGEGEQGRNGGHEKSDNDTRKERDRAQIRGRGELLICRVFFVPSSDDKDEGRTRWEATLRSRMAEEVGE